MARAAAGRLRLGEADDGGAGTTRWTLVRGFPTQHVPPSRLPILVLRRDGYYLCLFT